MLSAALLPSERPGIVAARGVYLRLHLIPFNFALQKASTALPVKVGRKTTSAGFAMWLKTVSALACVASVAGCGASTVQTGSNSIPERNRARICSVPPFRPGIDLHPTMTTSNDGYCGRGLYRANWLPFEIVVLAPPKHGEVRLLDGVTTKPRFRYYPEAGYEGPDEFVLQGGYGGYLANFTVTVTE